MPLLKPRNHNYQSLPEEKSFNIVWNTEYFLLVPLNCKAILVLNQEANIHGLFIVVWLLRLNRRLEGSGSRLFSH